MTIHKLFAAQALLPDGWAENVLFELDSGGSLARVTTNAEPAGAAQAKGPVLPGMPKLNSHAFQRARTEERRVGKEGGSTWRSWWSPQSLKKNQDRLRETNL